MLEGAKTVSFKVKAVKVIKGEYGAYILEAVDLPRGLPAFSGTCLLTPIQGGGGTPAIAEPATAAFCRYGRQHLLLPLRRQPKERQLVLKQAKC